MDVCFLDAAEVVLFQCIKHDKEEEAIEMDFEFLDDFQDPIKGGLYGLVRSYYHNSSTQDDSLELGAVASSETRKFPVSPVEFSNHNHILQWMVIKRANIMLSFAN